MFFIIIFLFFYQIKNFLFTLQGNLYTITGYICMTLPLLTAHFSWPLPFLSLKKLWPSLCFHPPPPPANFWQVPNVRFWGKQFVIWVCFPESPDSWCFPRRSRGKHKDSRKNITNRFREGPDIKCLGLVIFLDFHFNALQQQQKNTFKRNELKQSTQYL